MHITSTSLSNTVLRSGPGQHSAHQEMAPPSCRTPEPAVQSQPRLAGLALPERKIFWQEPSSEGLHSLNVNSRQKDAIEGALRRAGFSFVPRPPNPLKALPTEVLQAIGSHLAHGDFLRLRETGNVGAAVAARSMNSSVANLFVERLLPIYFGTPNKRLGVPALGIVPTTHHTLLRCSLRICDEVVSEPVIHKCVPIVQFLLEECQNRKPLNKIKLNLSKSTLKNVDNNCFWPLYLSSLTRVTENLTLGKYFDQSKIKVAAEKILFDFRYPEKQDLYLKDILFISNISRITIGEDFLASEHLSHNSRGYRLSDHRPHQGGQPYIEAMESEKFTNYKIPLIRSLFEHKTLEMVILETRLRIFPDREYLEPLYRKFRSDIARDNSQRLIDLAHSVQLPHKKRKIILELEGGWFPEWLYDFELQEAGVADFLHANFQERYFPTDLRLSIAFTEPSSTTAAWSTV